MNKTELEDFIRIVVKNPVSFIAALVIALSILTPGIWFIVYELYEHQINTLESNIKLKNDQIASLNENLNNCRNHTAPTSCDSCNNKSATVSRNAKTRFSFKETGKPSTPTSL